MSQRITYLVNRYPAISHSFIRREILALERQGLEIQRIALHGWDGPLADDADREERARTRYVLKEGPVALLLPVLSAMIARPRCFLRGLALAIRMARGAQRPLPYHLAYLAEACRIVRWAESFGATHLHAHFGTNSAEVAMLVRKLGGPPYSFTIHGQDELLAADIRAKVTYAEFVVAISSFGRAQVYLHVSDALWPKVKVVRCGVDAQFHDITPTDPPADERLVCVGRLCAEKGQLILIQAARRLADKGVPFKLVLAGDGEMRAQAEQLIAALGLTTRVRITGWLSSAQVREEILAARGLVLPSFTEGLPVVIMEAMALGRPVISTYVGGIPELVVPNESGWLVPTGSVDSLAAAMEECLATPVEELRRMGDAGRTRVIALHAIDSEAGKLARLFATSEHRACQ